jgi:hypothetical protein
MADWSKKFRPQEQTPGEQSALDYYFANLAQPPRPSPTPSTTLAAGPPRRDWWNPYGQQPGLATESPPTPASAPATPGESTPLYAGPPPKDWWNPYSTQPGIVSAPRPDPGYNVLSSANTGLRPGFTPTEPPPTPPALPPGAPGYWSPTSTMRPPAAAPPEATPTATAPDLDKILLDAQIDNLMSTGNARPMDLSGLEEAAAKLAPNKMDTLARMLMGAGAGTSPHFGVNVAQGGLAALNANDEKLSRYNIALHNIAQVREQNRSNIQQERSQAIDVAKPPGRTATTDPVLGSMLRSQEAIWKSQIDAILDDDTNPRYLEDPALRQEDVNRILAERENFYRMIGGQPGGGETEEDFSDE